MSDDKDVRIKFARSGGLARAKKLSKKRLREIGLHGAKVRWGKRVVKYKDNSR